MNTKTAAGISAIVIALTAGIFSVAAIGDESAPEQGERGKAFHQMGRKGNMKGNMKNSEHFAEVQSTLEAGDYTAWKEIMGDRGVSEYVTEENFSRFVDMHNLMKDGDREGAQAIAEELGLPEKRGNMGKHKGQLKKGLQLSQEDRDAARAAVEAGDYDAWKEIVGDESPMSEKINQDNFGRFGEMHTLRNQARSIAEELGLDSPGMKRGQR